MCKKNENILDDKRSTLILSYMDKNFDFKSLIKNRTTNGVFYFKKNKKNYDYELIFYKNLENRVIYLEPLIWRMLSTTFSFSDVELTIILNYWLKKNNIQGYFLTYPLKLSILDKCLNSFELGLNPKYNFIFLMKFLKGKFGQFTF